MSHSGVEMVEHLDVPKIRRDLLDIFILLKVLLAQSSGRMLGLFIDFD